MYKDNTGVGIAVPNEREVIFSGRSPSSRYHKNVIALRAAHKKLVKENKHQVNYESS